MDISNSLIKIIPYQTKKIFLSSKVTYTKNTADLRTKLVENIRINEGTNVL